MLKLVERGFFRSQIRLEEVGPKSESPDVQILRVGSFNHPKYGKFSITAQTLSELKQNFDNRVRGIDVAIDYFHDSDKVAAGWPKELYLLNEGTELWAKVDWTPKARTMLAEREVRYFSPDFAFEWEDPETGKVFKNVLFGGGLTNRPFVKDMAAIVASEQKGGTMNEEEKKLLADLQAKLLKLSEEAAEDKKQMGIMKKKLEEMDEEDDEDEDQEHDGGGDDDETVPALKKKLAEMTKKCAEYEEAAKKHAAAAQLAEKEKQFNILLTEGKACAAQKESFLKGDMDSFVKLSQPVNLRGQGHSGGGNDSGDDREDKVLKLAEEKMKADAKLSRIDAITLANREVQ